MVIFHNFVGLPEGNIGKNENKQLEVSKPWRFQHHPYHPLNSMGFYKKNTTISSRVPSQQQIGWWSFEDCRRLIPGLVNIQKAIENDHRDSGFTH